MKIDNIERCVMGIEGEITRADLEHEFKSFGINLFGKLKEDRQFKKIQEISNIDNTVTKVYETPIIQFYMKEYITEDRVGNVKSSMFQIKPIKE